MEGGRQGIAPGARLRRSRSGDPCARARRQDGRPGRGTEAGMAGQAVTRRPVLAALLLGPLLAACAPPRTTQVAVPDRLIGLAAAARTDAALAAAVIAAAPDLAGRVAPLRDARTQHAAALEAEVARQAGIPTSPATPAPTPTAGPP